MSESTDNIERMAGAGDSGSAASDTIPSAPGNSTMLILVVLLVGTLLASTLVAAIVSGILSVVSTVLLRSTGAIVGNLMAHMVLFPENYRSHDEPPIWSVATIIMLVVLTGALVFEMGIVEVHDCTLLHRIPDSEDVATYVRNECSWVSAIFSTVSGLLIIVGPVAMLLIRLNRASAVAK